MPGKGGPRPGAGAPLGNLNALRTGRHSKQLHHLFRQVLKCPEATQTLKALVRRGRGDPPEGTGFGDHVDQFLSIHRFPTPFPQPQAPTQARNAMLSTLSAPPTATADDVDPEKREKGE